jgi:SLOG in TRPM, prokaryote
MLGRNLTSSGVGDLVRRRDSTPDLHRPAAGQSRAGIEGNPLTLSTERTAYDRAVRRLQVERWSDLPAAVATLGFDHPMPTLAVVGGAAQLTDDDHARLQPLFTRLAELADRHGAAVVDGGTDTGVMRLLGRSRAAGHTFPLVGVVVSALAGRQWELEPNHSDVLLVPGQSWGDETRWLARVATLIAEDAPSATVLVNGGPVSYADAEASLAEGRRLIVAAGTGGTADEIAIGGDDAVLRDSDLVKAVDVSEDAGQPLIEELERILSDGSR